jgi:hypothetical protein
MNMLSENLVKTIIEEKHREATRLSQAQKARRLAKERYQAESQKDEGVKNFWQMLKELAGRLRFEPRRNDEVAHSGEDLYHAEKRRMTLEELHRLIENSLLYERIARGNALFEAEDLSQKLREGR